MSIREERRTDNDLREAIDRIKAAATPGANVAQVYDQILQETLQLTHADYGLIATVSPPGHEACVTPQSCFRLTPSDNNTSDNPYSPTHLPKAIAPTATFIKLLQNAHPIIRHDSATLMQVLPLFGNALDAKSTENFENTPVSAFDQRFKSTGIFPLREGNTVRLVLVILTECKTLPDRLLTRMGALSLHATCALRALDSTLPNSATGRFLANRQLVNLIRTSMSGIVTVDDALQITLINPSAEQLFGLRARELLDKPLTELFPNITAARLNEFKAMDSPHTSASPGQSQPRAQLEGKRSNQTYFPAEVVVFDTLARGVQFTTLLIEDISEKAHLHQQYEESLNRLRVLSDLAPVGIIQVDAQWQCVYANDQWMKLSGLNRHETIGLSWVNAISTTEIESVLSDLSHALLNQSLYLHQIRLVSPLGQHRWVQMTARGLFDQTDQHFNGFLATFADINEQRQAQERLRALAESDALTGLVNRTYLTNCVRKALSRENCQYPVAVLYLDLDGFKQVNDSYGHATGDQLLKRFSQRLRHAVRDSDVVARLGGDEFAVLIEHVPSIQAVENIATNLLQDLTNPIQIAQDLEVFVGASIGIALSNPGDLNAEDLLKQADLAMYRAKTSGKNTTCIYSPELGSVMSKRMELRNQLHRAIEREELAVYYQPQIDLTTGMIWGFEALLRWQNPVKGFISPTEFVPVLEETGLVRSVGIWVIEQACTALMHWRALGLANAHTCVSVNVSAIQLHDKSFVTSVKQALDNSGLNPGALVIEITETALVQGSLSQEILTDLRALGAKISLDDFGTGYSSLSYITRLPLDHLKIDRSFIASIPTDTHSVHITRAIISMAKGMGLTVVAEGVDNTERLSLLKSTQCDIYQGFHFSKAVSSDQIRSQLEERIHEKNTIKSAERCSRGQWQCLAAEVN